MFSKSVQLLSLLLTASTFALGQSNAAPTGASANDQKREDRVQLVTQVVEESRPMTLEDILSIREPSEPRISPDGKTVAFIVRQAFPDTNENRCALFTVSTDVEGRPIKWLEEKGSLSNIRWGPRGEYLTYLSGEGTGIQRLNRPGESAQQLFQHTGGISQFEWSADGKYIAFVSTERVSPESKRQLEDQGIVYDDYMTIEDLIGKAWPKNPKELWVYEVSKQTARKLAERESPVYPITDLSIAPNGKYLAYSWHRFGSRDPYGWDVEILTTNDGSVVRSFKWNGREHQPSWAPAGNSLAFLSTEDVDEKLWAGSSPSAYSVAIDKGEPAKIGTLVKSFRGKIWWRQDGKELLFEHDDRSRSSLYAMSVSNGQIRKLSQSADHLSQFSFDTSQSRVACIQQNPTMPPEIAVMDLSDGKTRVLTKLNLQLSRLKLGEVQELTWTNKYKHKANGFLIKPVDYVAGKRYPFLVVLYDFTGKYIAQAHWINSYPAQVFAAKGYAVMLMNFPETHPYKHGDAKEGLDHLVYNGLASILQGADLVTQMGIADPDKKGILGWSRGCFMTSVTITQSAAFKAASAGDGFLFTPSTYWSTHKIFRYSMEAAIGGAPYGDHLQAYSEVSPTLRANRVQTPVLLEYVAKNIKGVEFYIALRNSGLPVEYVAYPDETHSFSQPRHRLASMARNLDWFDFWLLNKEDKDPAKRKQYQQWNVMREEWTRKASTSSAQ